MRKQMRKTMAVVLAGAGLMAITSGCVSDQYEKVAKEWSTAIRANQMVPVYPLSQDLRPGDVFLVQRNMADQVKEYQEKGFLALDDSRKRLRLPPAAYGDVYFAGYFKGEFAPVDYPGRNGVDTSIRPLPVAGAGAGVGGAALAAGVVPTSLQGTPAPRAAFPTYSFSVKRGEGMSLGLPISGIPVAMNFLNAAEATGIVTLADASTYQADHDAIMAALTMWSRKPTVASELKAACEYAGQEFVFLRVIKRVYMVGAVDVSLQTSEKSRGGVQAGLGGQAADPDISVNDFDASIEKQNSLLSRLNGLAGAGKIGGSVSFNTATDRNVGLREVFDRPLVVGYLGIDVPYFKSGQLGAPIPTYKHLTEQSLRDPQPLKLDEIVVLNRALSFAARDEGRVDAALAAIMEASTALGFLDLASECRTIASTADNAERANQTRQVLVKFTDEVNFNSTMGSNPDDFRDHAIEVMERIWSSKQMR